MTRAVVNALPEKEFLLIGETQPEALSALTEDELVALHTRIQRARGKYVKNYRREASAKVSAQGGRGKARPKNTLNRDRAEVFEDALARVSRAVAAAAKASAAELKAERLAAAAAAKSGQAPARSSAPAAAAPRSAKKAANHKVGDRSTTNVRTVRAKAQTTAAGARRQAKRDSR
jgi:hypothetical protein